jgi:hypothetical protein
MASRINSRAKGATGEREFCKWLSDNLGIHHGERNLEQVRSGGADVTNCYPFVFEVKRVEKLDIQAAWIQCKKAWLEIATNDVDGTVDANLIPVVSFRYNNKPWEFLISAELIGNDRGFLRVSENTFIEYAKRELDLYAREAITSMANSKRHGKKEFASLLRF